MSINSEDFISSAKFCLSHENEVGYRSYISRAYYGMFHEAMASLTNVPAFSSNHHGNLIGYMTNAAECKSEPYDKRKLKAMGYNLKQMRDSRNEADYHITEITITKEIADAAIFSAELFFSKWTALKEVKAS